MRCLKKAIALEMYRELPTTTGVASRLTVPKDPLEPRAQGRSEGTQG